MSISELVQKQKAYFQRGETLDLDFRQEALKKILAALSDWEPDILEALALDLNKSDIEAYITEIGTVKAELKHIIRKLPRWAKKTRARTPLSALPGRSYVLYEPYGCVLIMSPWNYPFMLTLSPLVGALAAGNCALVKPSAYAPHTAALIDRMIKDLFDEEYCACVLGSRKENTALLEEDFDYIFFTGSVNVGRLVMEKASRHLTPVTLELGGKSPAIVDETADLDLAAKRLVFGKFINAGQTCIAPDYLLVHESKMDELIRKLKFHIEVSYPKDAAGRVMDYPCIVNRKHFDRLSDLLAGEKIVIGGGLDPERLSIEPTVLAPVAFDAPVMQEEIFGPLLPLIPYKDLDWALSRIRERPKPLALYLFSQNRDVWRRIEKTVSFGGGCINDTLLHIASPHLPFGGVGESGMGRYHGKASFLTFSHLKGILKKASFPDPSVRYRPYTENSKKILRKL